MIIEQIVGFQNETFDRVIVKLCCRKRLKGAYLDITLTIKMDKEWITEVLEDAARIIFEFVDGAYLQEMLCVAL